MFVFLLFLPNKVTTTLGAYRYVKEYSTEFKNGKGTFELLKLCNDAFDMLQIECSVVALGVIIIIGVVGEEIIRLDIIPNHLKENIKRPTKIQAGT